MSSSPELTQPSQSPLTITQDSQQCLSPSASITPGMGSSQHSSSQSMSSQTSSSLGPDGQSLLCSESMLSSTPPSDESQKQTDKDGLPWKHSEETSRYHSPQPVVGCHSVTSATLDRSREFQLLSDSQSNSRNTPITQEKSQEHEHTSGSNHSAATTGQKMTDEQYKTLQTITTTSEHLNWLADVAVGHSEQRPIAGMQSATLPQQPSNLPSGTLFRPPHTEYNAAQRLYTPGQFSTVYSTSSLGQVPFPSLQYSPHIPPETLHSSTLPTYSPYLGGPYSTAYIQPGFPHSQLAGGQFPQIESYSAMLASMGSHVQAHAQGQGSLHRSFIPAHVAHLPSHYVTSVGSPHSADNPDKATPPGAAVYSAVQGVHGQHVVVSGPVSVSPGPSSQGPVPRTEVKRERIESSQGAAEESLPSIHCKSEGSVYAAVNRSPRQSPQTVSAARAPSSSGIRSREREAMPSTKQSRLEERSLRPNRPPNININPKYELLNQSHHRPPDRQPGSPQVTLSGPPTPSWSTAVNPMPPPPQPPQTPPHTPHTPHTPNTPLNSTSSNSQYQLSPPAYSNQPPHPHFPPHFMKGSIIQLASGELKKVEDLRTEDFVQSAAVSEDLKIDSSTVVRIDEDHQAGLALLGFSVGEHRIQVTVESTVEHPFFVFGQGWSSVRPDRTLQRYGLSCHHLSVGDVCISLTLKDKNGRLQQKEVKPDVVRSDTTEDIAEPEFKRPKLEAPFLPHHSLVAKTGKRRSGVEVTSQQTIVLYSHDSVEVNDKQQKCHSQHTNGNNNTVKESTLHTQKSVKSSRVRKRRWSDPIQFVEKEKDDDLPVPLPLESLAKLSQKPAVHSVSGN